MAITRGEALFDLGLREVFDHHTWAASVQLCMHGI